LGLLLLLASCGGGGTGDGGSSAPPPALTLSPTSAEATAIQGTSAEMTVNLTLSTAAADSTVYIGIEDSASVIESADFTSATRTTATLTLHSVTTLSVGQHSGVLNFYLCKDSSCSSLVSDTPARFTYTITITPAPPVAVITPSPLTATIEAQDALQIAVTADVAAVLYVGAFRVDDPQGFFDAAVTVSAINGQRYTLTLSASPKSVAGTYTGTINLQACGSDCAYSPQLPGSPVQIPYTITVTPFVPLPPVPTASGLPEWETHQGNTGHTGFVPVTLDPSRFAPRWTWSLPAGASGTLSPVTAGSGKVVIAASGFFNDAFLFALDEANGSIAWRHDFGSIFAVNHPATAGGRVFVASSGHADTFMWAFDLADGTQLFKTPFASQWEHYLAPAFRNGFVYTNGGTYGGMYAFKATTGVQKWFANLGQYDLWSPAVDDQNAYAYTGAEFAAIDLLTGARVFSIADPAFNWLGYALNMSPVLPGDGSVLLVNGVYSTAHANQLIRYDVASASERWRVDGNFTSDPVVADGVVYVLDASDNQLEARDQGTGTLLWSWHAAGPQETTITGNLLLTENLIFLSTSAATYAIDLSTHQAVWSAPVTGALAMSSNRVLYIVTSTGTLNAFDLN
jgi:outer membrane protein assembly factor BamB